MKLNYIIAGIKKNKKQANNRREADEYQRSELED